MSSSVTSSSIHAPKPTELHLGWLENFNRLSRKANAWLDTVRIYITNKNLHNTNDKKIAFTLSFMKEGSTQMWASAFTKKALSYIVPSFRTYLTSKSNLPQHLFMKTQRVKPVSGSPTLVSQKDYHSMTTSPSSRTMLKSVASLTKMH